MTSPWLASPWLIAPLLIVVGSRLLTLMMRRVAPDPFVTTILFWSYRGRVILTVALFCISFWQWPLLRSLQTTAGFWMFGLDCTMYHHHAIRIVDAWNHGLELPNPGLRIEYFIVIALIYKLLGPHPLYPALFNSWLSVVTGLLAYLISRRLIGRRAALTTAVLVSFWPSSLIWPTQLLKDSLAWFLIFSAFWLILQLVPERETGGWSLRPRWLLRWLALGMAIVLLTRLRFYLGSVFSLAAIVSFAPAAALALIRRRIRTSVCYASLVILIVTSTLFARTINTVQLFSPRYPAIGHLKLALELQQREQFSSAEAELRRAVALQHHDAGALLELLPIAGLNDRREEVIALYDYHLNVGGAIPTANLQMSDGTTAPRAPTHRQPSTTEQRSHDWSQMDDQMVLSAQEMTPQFFGLTREGFVASGGHSLMDAWARIFDFVSLAAYLPRAVVVGLFAPFPWQWFDTKGSTGIMRTWASVEMVLIYLLIPALIAGVRNIIKQRRVEGIFLLTAILFFAVSMSLVVANLGTLFRLRLQFLLPLLLVIAAGDPLAIYGALLARLKQWMSTQKALRAE